MNMETNLKGRIGRIGQETRKLWNKVPLIYPIVVTALAGGLYFGYLAPRKQEQIKAETKMLNYCVDALTEREFDRRYPADKYSQGIAIKDEHGSTYVARYSDMKDIFMSKYASVSDSPIAAKLSEEGSEFRRETIKREESLLRNGQVLSCDNNLPHVGK